jgi:S-DNA-T family DNA segregation ATPase FtsK/SpoIIIE
MPVAAPDRAQYPTLVVVTTRPDDVTRNWGGSVGGSVMRLNGRRASLTSGGSSDPLVVSVGAEPTTIVGDPEAWQANWSLLGSLRSSALMVFDRCSLADFRAISGARALPPPLAHNSEQCWSLDPEGTIGRIRAPMIGGESSGG